MVGEIVFVIDNDKKRQNWKLGLVQRTFEGNDGKARVADMKVGKDFSTSFPTSDTSGNSEQ